MFSGDEEHLLGTCYTLSGLTGYLFVNNDGTKCHTLQEYNVVQITCHMHVLKNK